MAFLFRTASLAAALALAPAHGWARDRSTIYYYSDPQNPLKIDARALSVNERDRTATFSGNVVVTLGSVHMRCSTLVVHYDGAAPSHRDSIGIECKPSYLHFIE